MQENFSEKLNQRQNAALDTLSAEQALRLYLIVRYPAELVPSLCDYILTGNNEALSQFIQLRESQNKH